MLILALDLATRTGWCLGKADAKAPAFGSIRFGSPGASHEALFAHALTWASYVLKKWKPDRIVFEEPLHFRGGASRRGNDEILYGLPAIIQGVANLRGIYDVRRARVFDVRQHFIGRNPRSAIAKKATVDRCRLLGWNVEDDNQGDACAIWSYACSFVDPQQALRPTPLFSGKASRSEGAA